MVKQTIFGHLKCWLMWDIDDKLISVLDVVGHRVIFLYQAKGKYVKYPLGVIPNRIKISGEVKKIVVCHSCIIMVT